MNVPFLVSNILSGVGMLAMLASTALRSRKKILAVQSVNHALSMGGLLAFARLERRGAGGREPRA